MPNNRDTTPDIIFCTENIKSHITNLEVIPDIRSDHLSIIFTFNTNNPISPAANPVMYNFHRSDVQHINQEINYFLEEHQHHAISEQLIGAFNNKLEASIADNTPKCKHQFFPHTLPPFIVKQIKIKRQLYREYKRNNYTLLNLK